MPEHSFGIANSQLRQCHLTAPAMLEHGVGIAILLSCDSPNIFMHHITASSRQYEIHVRATEMAIDFAAIAWMSDSRRGSDIHAVVQMNGHAFERLRVHINFIGQIQSRTTEEKGFLAWSKHYFSVFYSADSVKSF